MATQFVRSIYNRIFVNAHSDETQMDVIGLTERLINDSQTQGHIPTVRELGLWITTEDLSGALIIASAWVTDLVGISKSSAALDIGSKWKPMHRKSWPIKTDEIPAWALKILLVECWEDVRKVHNNEHIEE